jgi:adenine-specific DNA-methyltransferase
MHPLKRRLLVEEFARLRRAGDERRYAASQRRGRIDPNPHQIDAVVFALQRIPDGGCILADEVGLGKTIEAGLVIAQLLAEGMRRILLIVPKSLLGQWQTELYSLFGIQAHEGRLDPDAFTGEGVFLVHREFAGGAKGSSLLRAADPFDLVVIDEAHEVFAAIYKRFDAKDGHYRVDSDHAQTADRVRSLLSPHSTPLLLLTATPIQNSLAELWGLVQYVEPTGLLLGKLPTFREVFCEETDRKLLPEVAHELRRRLGSVLQRTLRRQAQEFLEVPFVQRQSRLIEYSMTPDEERLYKDVTQWLMSPTLCAFGGNNRRILLIGFHRRLASSLAALTSSLEKVAERLRRKLAGQGGDSWEDLALEFAQDLEEELEEPENEGNDKPSKPPSLQRLRAELALVESFIQRGRAVPLESKASCLLEALRVIRQRGAMGEGTGKAVIFTESVQTQDFLYQLLTTEMYQPDQVTLFRGQNDFPRAVEALGHWEAEEAKSLPVGSRPSRQVAIRLALVEEFKKRSQVFIATEAGAKGLNLQFCETLINYDLPWNPQRIEQRIGRIHRYGQRRGVTILTFIDRGNEAQRLTFEILSQKLDLFGKVLDASDAVLHTPDCDFPEPLVSGLGLDFETQLRRVYQSARSIDEVNEQLRNLRESMDARRKQFDEHQARATELIETRLEGSVRQVFRKYRDALPAGLDQLDRELDTILHGFLEAIGAGFERSDADGRIVYRLWPSERLPVECRDGGLYVIGHARDLSEGEPLHPGHALLRAAVEEARAVTAEPLCVEFVADGRELPACVKPLLGRAGKLVVTRLSYRGLEAVDHLLATGLLEHELTPLTPQTVESLLTLTPRTIPELAPPPSVDEAALQDAIDEAILDDQAETTTADQARFERKLEQLDRYLEDQILVLKRQQAALRRKQQDAEGRKQRAAVPSLLEREDKSIKSFESQIQRLEQRIERLERGEDSDYQHWRDRLNERRFRRPAIERLVEITFRVSGAAGC